MHSEVELAINPGAFEFLGSHTSHCWNLQNKETITLFGLANCIISALKCNRFYLPGHTFTKQKVTKSEGRERPRYMSVLSL
jgi:hypothetical protein